MPLSPPSGDGADPILVIATTHDPATPYSNALAVVEQLDAAVLLTVEGYQHTASAAGNTCVDEVVTRYLVDLVVPPEGQQCAED